VNGAPMLEMKGISKSFFGVEVLHKVDFVVQKGQIMGLCGENGAGKSTLMKILAGIHAPDGGEIGFRSALVRKNPTPMEMQNLGISMIHQELNLLDELTVAQNIFLCREPRGGAGLINFNRMNEEAARVLERLGEKIDPRHKVFDLKIAQKQMVEIAKAISFNVELLIMDEPTSMLTGKETKILFDLISNLSSQGIAVVYISHRLKEIIDVCHTVTVLKDGSLVAVKNVAEVSAQDLAALMVGRQVQTTKASDFSGDPEAVMLEVRDVSDDLLKGVSFKVRKGEILGFSGLVGAGRTELMEVVFGMRRPKTGSVFIEGKPRTIRSAIDAIRADLGFVTEDRKATGLVGCRDITDNANYVSWLKTAGLFKGRARSLANAKKMVDRLAIRCSSPAQLVSNLSGGNQQKVALSKWLLSGAKVLVLDEPTRGVDVGSRQEIYQIIRELAAGGVAIVIVSSDLPEILTICERAIIMHEGRVTGALSASELSEEKVMSYATDVGSGEIHAGT
jgi:ribose transport system ATP-binding protein